MAYVDRMFQEHPRPAADPAAVDLPELDDWVFAGAGTLAGFGIIAAGLTALLIWLAGSVAVLGLLPAYVLLLAAAAIRIRIDDGGLRVHALGFLPVTGLKLAEVDYAATGTAKVPFLGGVVLKSGGALLAGGVLEHAIIRSGPALVATGPFQLKVVVSAAGTVHARSMAELLNAYQLRVGRAKGTR